MTSEVGRRPAPVAPTITGPSLFSRIYGFGSIYGKTMRDSRRAVIAISLVMGLGLVAVSFAIVQEFNTPESRQQLVAVVAAVPAILAGLAGKAVNVGDAGRVPPVQVRLVLPDHRQPLGDPRAVGDARRGGASRQPRVRRRERDDTPPHRAREALRPPRPARRSSPSSCSWRFFCRCSVHGLPGDAITVQMAAGYALWLFLLGIAAGAVAFALAPFVGRGSAAGVAGAVMFGGFIVNGYQAAIPTLAPLANLTWFGWTSNHVPLAGQFDWVSLAPGGARRARPVRHRGRGVRPSRHRRHDRRSPRRACRGRWSASADPPGRAVGQDPGSGSRCLSTPPSRLGNCIITK